MLDEPVPTESPSGFQCLICGSKFAHSDKLVAHSFAHTGIKPFNCPSCPRTFTRNERMRDHIKRYHLADGPE